MAKKISARVPRTQKDTQVSAKRPETDSQQAPGSTFSIVGIGASAGGLGAFEAFFSGMPADTDPGMAFVLVQHLAPDHKSILTDLIRRYTRMEVFEVEDGMEVKPNCAYIIPPNRDMAFLNRTLHLLEPSAPRGQRLPIDFFFRSLAQDQREKAIGIILSGTGSDGTQGVRAIKGEGGMVMAQTPASTEYDGMPRSAIASGVVDFELPPAEMGPQLIAFVNHTSEKSFHLVSSAASKAEHSIQKIFILLRTQTSHDFSHYKPTTILRRIQRRMAVHQIESMDDYVKLLQQTSTEVEALFRDLLIGVTNFFRDPEAYTALEKLVIPKLFAGKPPDALIRVWSPGCSTGEEAYSLGILLQECQDSLKQRTKIQVFSSDIDSLAITKARTGLYPASISADISPERLARFFSTESDGSAYRIHKVLRDMVVFSEQNVIKDPPFSKLDLISCRNLLIYLDGDLQKKLIPLFHYALNPNGFLFLGTSETIGDFSDLFITLDRKLKIYQRKENIITSQRKPLSQFLPPLTDKRFALPRGVEKTTDSEKLPLRELTEQAILQELAPVAVLVNAQGVILYLHGRSGLYLEPTPGEVGVMNVLKMAREGLRCDLTIALHKATGTNEVVRYPNVRVKTNGTFTTVNLTVRPVKPRSEGHLETPLYLVLLDQTQPLGHEQVEAVNPHAIPADDSSGTTTDVRIAALTKELREKEEYLQSSNEELETSNEELKSSNEEMQSVNEELQSTNEELETSKEELQSVNEELATVNVELQSKVADLSRANNDMNNLMAGTGIATIFVDHHLCILRFTPAATTIINLIQADVGRPVGHIVSNLVGYDRLVADAQAVLDTLAPKEIEVQTTESKWYTMLIRPYRTIENVIEGVVITFSDITEIKNAQGLLAKTNDLLRLAVVVRDSHEAILMLDLEGSILAWNPSAQRMFGWSEAEALKMNVRDITPEELGAKETDKLLQIAKSDIPGEHTTKRLTKSGEVVQVWLTVSSLVNETGQVYALATTERVVRERSDS